MNSIAINPENPHVHDAYFHADQTQLSFEQTSFYIFHKANNFLAFFIGLLLNLLVIYLILYKTPSHFKAYSKMLLLCELADMITILNDFLCQTVSQAFIVFCTN